MKKLIIISITFLIISCSITTINKDPGSLPEEGYIPKIGFEPTQKAINEQLSKIEESVRTIFPDYTPVMELNFYFAVRRSIDPNKITEFEKCYGSEINEEIQALFTRDIDDEAFEFNTWLKSAELFVNPFYHNTGCYGMAFTDSGLYISRSKTDRVPNNMSAISNIRYFISYDELYDPETKFTSGGNRRLFIGLKDKQIYAPTFISPADYFVEIFENARKYSLEGSYAPYDAEVRNFTMKKIPEKLVNLYQSAGQQRLYFNSYLPEGTEDSFRRCMNLNINEKVLFVINTKSQPLFSRSLCQGLVATQKGFHLRNTQMTKYPEKTGYRYIPYSYYRENTYNPKVRYLEYGDRRVTDYIYLTPVDALNLTGAVNPFFGKDYTLIEALIAYVIKAVQGDVASSDQIQQIIDQYQKSLEKPKPIVKKQKTTKQRISSSSGKSFFERVGNILMPIVEIAMVLAIADTLGDDTCDMPRKPRANQLYGMQMLNRQPLSPPKDFNKQMNVYNKRAANAKKHCDDKKKDLGLLLSLLD